MKLAIVFGCCFLLNSVQLLAQEISAKVVDSKTGEAIPFATVQYAKHRGTVTNDEGVFSLLQDRYTVDSLTISSIGYKTESIKASEIKNGSIKMQSQNIELANVYLTNKNLSAEEIIVKVKENITKNYNFDYSKKRFFLRRSFFNNVKKFDLEVEESTIPELNQEFMNKIVANVPKYSDSYKEMLGDLYGNYKQNKVQLIKAANLENPASTENVTQLTDKLKSIFQENVKKSSFLKIKSGIIGVKVDADELEEGMAEDDVKEEKVKTPEEIEKDLQDSKKSLARGTESVIKHLFSTLFWQEDIPLNILKKDNRYDFKTEGFLNLDNSIVYVITFKPKRNEDFRGKMYVNTTDFGVHRIDYMNVQPLKKFSLFGISTKDDVYCGKMIFSRDSVGKYNPRYLEQEQGESIGVDRPLTIIEKNRVVAGKNKQNELDLEIRVNFSQITKNQLVIYDSEELDENTYSSFSSSPEFEYGVFKKYDPNFWEGFNIIEPNTAIKSFTALEEPTL